MIHILVQQRQGMNCPYCASNLIRKNGHRRGKQNDICTSCDVRSAPLR